MSVKYIVGVDAAIRNVGVSVHDNTGKALTSFNITTTNGMNDHDSVDIVVAQFFDRLAPYMTPEVLSRRAIIFYFEDIVFGQKGKATLRAEATGVLKWCIRQQELDAYGVTPPAVWSFFMAKCGLPPNRLKTADKKMLTMQLLHKRFNFYTNNDNIADAYVLGMLGYAHQFEGKRLSVRALGRIRHNVR